MYWIFTLVFLSAFQKDFVPEDMVWKHRIIIYSGERDLSDWFSEDLSKGLTARKLLFFHFKDSTLVNTNFKESIQTAAFLRKLELNPTVEEKWVLIGLDGAVKNSGLGAPSTTAIFRIIDAMPMRQSEIRSGDN